VADQNKIEPGLLVYLGELAKEGCGHAAADHMQRSTSRRGDTDHPNDSDRHLDAPSTCRNGWHGLPLGLLGQSRKVLSPLTGVQPQVALPLARVMVIWPIVVSALAPCQWRSPALT